MSVISGIVGAIAGKRGADAQASAARNAAAVAERIFQTTRSDNAFARKVGTNALNALEYEVGLDGKPGNYAGFQASPGYAFVRDEGQRAIDRSAAARGALFSGETIKAQQRFGTGLAAQEYNNYLNRLGSLANTGQVATNSVTQAGLTSAGQQGNALMAAGNARASGYQAIGGGVQNALAGIGQIAGFGLGGGFSSIGVRPGGLY